jgi:WD40 repeat protein
VLVFDYLCVVLFYDPVLASCSRVSTDEKLHDNVVLTAAQSGAKLDSLQHDQDWKRPAGTTTSVAFGGKSRYLCLGDSSGAVCLWDLKKRLRVRQFFHDGYPSRQVSLDPTDKYVVSLSDRLLSIYNLREGTLAMTLSPPGSFSFTRFHISPMEPNVAAVGTTDGSILLYDITDKESPTPFFALNRRHAGAITGLAISPQNAQLLAATSDDGTLMFFDRQSGETIHQLAALASPITCMSLHYDGMSCAVGTESGEVFMYDLRENTPLSSLRVKYAVSSIQFAPPPKNADQNNQTKSEPSSTKKQTTPRYDQSDDTYQESRQSDGGGREAPPSSITNNNTKPTSPQKSSAQKSIATFGTQGNTSQATFGTQNALPSQVASQSSFGTQNAQPSIMPAGFRGLLSDIEQRIPRENHAATPPENPPTPREYQAPIPREHHAPAPREYHVPAPVHQIQPGTTTEPSIKVVSGSRGSR